VAARSVISDCIDKLQKAADARQKAHNLLLEDDDISPSERRSLEHTINVENRRIRQCADKINEALQEAVARGKPVGSISVSTTLSDPLLAKFVRSVEQSVRRLNTLVDTDGPDLGRVDSEMGRQLGKAQKHEESYERAIAELKQRIDSIEKQLKSAEKLEKDHKRQVTELDERLQKIEASRKKYRDEERRVDEQESRMTREVARHERELSTTKNVRRSARNLDRKRSEKAKGLQLQKKIDDLKARRQRTIETKRAELKQSKRFFDREHKQLQVARERIQKDVDTVARQISELRRHKEESTRQLREEEKRLQQVRGAISKMHGAKARMY
jgi:chromosome segregation ATPase